MQRSLSAAVRKISTSSLPAINVHPAAINVHPNGAGAVTGGSAPTSPMVTAKNREPLQPLTGPHTPAPPRPAVTMEMACDWGDKYSALADLDCAFTAPDTQGAPPTAINWTPPSAQEGEGEEEGVQGHPGIDRAAEAQGHPPPVPSHPTPVPSHPNPFLSPMSAPAPHPAPGLADGDRYAALASLQAAGPGATALNWGPSQSAEEESEVTADPGSPAGGASTHGHVTHDTSGGGQWNSAGRQGLAGATPSGYGAGVLSSSPPGRSRMAGQGQGQLYGPSGLSGLHVPAVTAAAMGYGVPAQVFHHPPTPHPAFSPVTNAGFVYPQYPAAHHGSGVPTAVTCAGYPGMPALAGVTPQVVPLAAQGGGWVPSGNAPPPSNPSTPSTPSNPSPSHPLSASVQRPHQAPVCLS
ncbi:hypothetical protein ACOMHN_060648 [Nucella lapillus]